MRNCLKGKGIREAMYQIGCTILRMSIRRHGLIEMRLNENTIIGLRGHAYSHVYINGVSI